MDFRISDEHSRLQQRCRALAADFATRSAEHDRAASHPTENYRRLRDEGKFKEAEAVWQGLEALYRNDPAGDEVLQEVRRDRGP